VLPPGRDPALRAAVEALFIAVGSCGDAMSDTPGSAAGEGGTLVWSEDQGWFENPPGTLADAADRDEMRAEGIDA